MKLVREYLPKNTYLVNVDRESNLSNCLDTVENSIVFQDLSPLCEKTDEWFSDDAAVSVDYYINQLKNELSREYDEEKVENFVTKNYEKIEDIIYSRDISNPIRDLIDNTGNPTMYYVLDVDVIPYYDKEDFIQNQREIKKALGIKMRDKTYDKSIKRLIMEAGYYGGRLEIFFCEGLRNIMDFKKKHKTIIFENPMVVVADRLNGSGSENVFNGLEVRLKYDPKNVEFDDNHRHSYGNDICGMRQGWCDCTSMRLK
jgi:hypothetical protein